MSILVKCGDCGHEITVADRMAGRKGRCPKCNAVVDIPGGRRGKLRSPSAGLASVDPGSAHGRLALLGGLLTLVGLVAFLALAGTGVYTCVRALQGPEYFEGPFGLFSEYADEARTSPTMVGIAFLVGGLVLGGLVFLVLGGAGQCLRLFISMEQSLRNISNHLGSAPE